MTPHARCALLFACSLSLAFIESALADDSHSKPIEIPITATRFPFDPLSPSTTTVLDLAPPLSSTSPAEALAASPGAHLDTQGRPGGVSSLYLRGADPNETLFLIDGVPINDPTNTRGGSVDLSSLPRFGFEKAEITRGQLSAIHGSDAPAGAVQLLSEPPEDGASLEASTGVFQEKQAKGKYGRDLLGVGTIALTGGYTDAGTSVRAGAAKHGGGALRFRGAEALDGVNAALHRYGSGLRAFPDDSGGPRFADLDEKDERDIYQTIAALSWTKEIESRWTLRIAGDYFGREETIHSPGVSPGLRDPFGLPPNGSTSELNRKRATGNLRWAPSEDFSLLFGGELRKERGESDGFLRIGETEQPVGFALDRLTRSAFLESRYRPIPDLVAEASLRADDADGFAPRFNPRGGVSYLLPTDTVVRSSYGFGYHLPSFFALGNPIVGNSALQPERARSWEAGATQLLPNGGTFTATWFDSSFQDAIDFETGPPPKLVNRTAIDTHGLELELVLKQKDAWELRGSFTRLFAATEETGEQLRNRPRFSSAFSFARTLTERLKGTLFLRYVGEVNDSSIPTGDITLSPWWRSDGSVSWSIDDCGELWLLVENILDKQYEQSAGFPAPGIRPQLGMRFRF